jgi:hypothetical protein
MKDLNNTVITREKHLDHMVKVVPFIVMCYFIQCFVIMKVAPGQFSFVSLSVLGGFLASMIGLFICYDLKHQVTLNEKSLRISFFSYSKEIPYDDIIMMEVREPGETFSALVIKTVSSRHTFHFIDDAEKIKEWIEKKQESQLMAA